MIFITSKLSTLIKLNLGEHYIFQKIVKQILVVQYCSKIVSVNKMEELFISGTIALLKSTANQ